MRVAQNRHEAGPAVRQGREHPQGAGARLHLAYFFQTLFVNSPVLMQTFHQLQHTITVQAYPLVPRRRSSVTADTVARTTAGLCETFTCCRVVLSKQHRVRVREHKAGACLARTDG